MSKLSELGIMNKDLPEFEFISTHLGTVVRFRDKESIQNFINSLQLIIDNNDTDPPYLYINHSTLNPYDLWRYLDWYTDILKYERSGLE